LLLSLSPLLLFDGNECRVSVASCRGKWKNGISKSGRFPTKASWASCATKEKEMKEDAMETTVGKAMIMRDISSI
jgi:hypothetical protein